MEWHPYAEQFPLLEGDEWAAFKADIKANGGIDLPIVYRMVNGHKQGLDGRNRLLACEQLGIKDPPMQKVFLDDAQAVAFIKRRNVFRRHLTRDQRQKIVGDLRAEGKSNREIAAKIGVDEKTVRRDIADMEEKDVQGAAIAAAPSKNSGKSEGKAHDGMSEAPLKVKPKPSREFEALRTLILDDIGAMDGLGDNMDILRSVAEILEVGED